MNMLRLALIFFAISVVAEMLGLITFTATSAAAQRDPE
jgi:uncharacterized membrane protein YtjA (UPF0391 family)